MLAKTEKFKWLVETCADSLCPVEIYHGSFIDSDEDTQWIPSGAYLNSQWGIGGASYVVGDDKRKVPERMQITWFSYAENKFYQGSFELPQKKMYELFKGDYGTTTGADGVEYKNEFNTLLLSFAPEGLVTLWMTGNGMIEIGTYQAKQISMDWKDFYGSQGTITQLEEVRDRVKEMPSFIQKEIVEGKISNAYIKSMLERYHYTITTNKPEEYTIYDYDSSFLNHEVINTSLGGIKFLTDKKNGKGMATNGSVYIQDKFGRQLEVRFDANLLENQKLYVDVPPLERRNKNIAYMKLWKDFFEKNKDVQFQIKFNKQIEKSSIDNPVVCGKIVLKSQTAELVIPNSRVEVFDAEE